MGTICEAVKLDHAVMRGRTQPLPPCDGPGEVEVTYRGDGWLYVETTTYLLCRRCAEALGEICRGSQAIVRSMREAPRG